MNLQRMFQSAKQAVLKHAWYAAIIAVCVVGVLSIAVYGSIAPNDFLVKTTITIEKNIGLNGVARELAKNRIIKSPFVYKAFVVLLGGRKKVMAGDYLFDSPQSALRVAYRTIKGIQGLPRIKITVPEGLASSDIARLIEKEIPYFDGNSFKVMAKENEGYLFPDTYFFYENVTPAQVIAEMKSNFDVQVNNLRSKVTSSGKSLEEIVKMASIVEEEASDKDDRRIIAGILWKRIENKMPLQVDAPFFYILGKTSDELSLDDLTMNSPHNLYKNTGLPPTPISNPGIDAIEAALNPLKTSYWFYLSDSEGVTHYATTYDGHIANKSRYLQ